jgi:hypothetical protein
LKVGFSPKEIGKYGIKQKKRSTRLTKRKEQKRDWKRTKKEMLNLFYFINNVTMFKKHIGDSK